MIFDPNNVLGYADENPWWPAYLLIMISNDTWSFDMWSLRTKETIRLSHYLSIYHRSQHLTQSPFYLAKEYLLEMQIGFIWKVQKLENSALPAAEDTTPLLRTCVFFPSEKAFTFLHWFLSFLPAGNERILLYFMFYTASIFLHCNKLSLSSFGIWSRESSLHLFL